MHEYSIAYDIYSTSKRAAIENSAILVKKVSVNVGELTMVNPEQVKFLFDIICEEDPIFKDAVLEYCLIETKVHCSCGYEGNEKYVCPRCGSLPEIIQGREVFVTNVEIEVEDA